MNTHDIVYFFFGDFVKFSHDIGKVALNKRLSISGVCFVL